MSRAASLDLHKPQYTSLVVADGKVFYANESLICWNADPGEFRTVFDGRFAKSRELATLEQFREQLSPTAASPEEVELRLAEHLGNPPLGCASPAFAQGHIYLRLQDCVACYDLRARKDVASTAE